MYKIGVVGCGVVGSTLADWVADNNVEVEVRRDDPAKNYYDPLHDCDAFFVAVPVPALRSGLQDTSILMSVVRRLRYIRDVPIFVRSTVLPGTCDMLSEMFGANVFAMPEFLTERTRQIDFAEQPLVVGHPAQRDILRLHNLLNRIFPGKPRHTMSNREAELTKFAHNCFGAMKVNYFNMIYEFCERYGMSYEKVKAGVLLSGYINSNHTDVPGPDGKCGYGGKCFPDNVAAFARFMTLEGIYGAAILNLIQSDNRYFRMKGVKDGRYQRN